MKAFKVFYVGDKGMVSYGVHGGAQCYSPMIKTYPKIPGSGIFVFPKMEWALTFLTEGCEVWEVECHNLYRQDRRAWSISYDEMAAWWQGENARDEPTAYGTFITDWVIPLRRIV